MSESKVVPDEESGDPKTNFSEFRLSRFEVQSSICFTTGWLHTLMALSNDLAALIGFALESLFYGPPSPIIRPPAIANLPYRLLLHALLGLYYRFTMVATKTQEFQSSHGRSKFCTFLMLYNPLCYRIQPFLYHSCTSLLLVF